MSTKNQSAHTDSSTSATKKTLSATAQSDETKTALSQQSAETLSSPQTATMRLSVFSWFKTLLFWITIIGMLFLQFYPVNISENIPLLPLMFGSITLTLYLIIASYRNYLIKQREKQNPPSTKQPIPPFKRVSVIKLLIYSLLSGGLYPVWLLSSHWKAIAATRNKTITPFLRSWLFGAVWIWQLAYIVRKRGNTKFRRFIGVYLGIALYLAITLFNAFLIAKLFDTTCLALTTLLLFLSFIPCLGLGLIGVPALLLLQRAINALHHPHPETSSKKIKNALKEIAVVLLSGSLIYGTVLVMHQPQNQSLVNWNKNNPVLSTLKTVYDNIPIHQSLKRPELTWEESNAVNFVIKSIYYNTLGYQTYCTSQGYDMQIYPDWFLEQVRQDLGTLENALQKRGLNLADLIKAFIQNNQQNVAQEIKNEFIILKRGIILENIATLKETTPDKIKWQEEFESILTEKDICVYLETLGIEVMTQNPHLFNQIHETAEAINKIQ